MSRSAEQETTRAGHDGAFTMVELLVTMVLLTIALLGLTALQVSVIKQGTASRGMAEATRLAQLVLERYHTMPYAQVTAFAPKDTWVTELKRDGVSTMVGVGPNGESDGPFTVQSFHESVGAGELVTVRVAWNAGQRGLDPDPAKQYQQMFVSLSVQRFP